MKKFLFFILISIFATQVSNAQKFGYVDSDFIMNKMPAYGTAQRELDKMSENWQKEIESMYKNIDKLYKNYQAEEVLLTEEMKKKRQDEIVKKEQEVKEYQKKIFGFEGTMFKKRQELIRPVQDQIFEAIEKVAKQKQLQIVFDKSGDLVMLYTNPVHDYTEYVLEELGLKDKEKNQPGQRPANALIDQPADVPVQSEDIQEEAPAQAKPTKAPAQRTTTTPQKTVPKKK